MSPSDYVAALHKAGAAADSRPEQLDSFANQLLRISKRSSRRYRSGEIVIPGPVQIALIALSRPLSERFPKIS